jgi:hypothetical protein
MESLAKLALKELPLRDKIQAAQQFPHLLPLPITDREYRRQAVLRMRAKHGNLYEGVPLPTFVEGGRVRKVPKKNLFGIYVGGRLHSTHPTRKQAKQMLGSGPPFTTPLELRQQSQQPLKLPHLPPEIIKNIYEMNPTPAQERPKIRKEISRLTELLHSRFDEGVYDKSIKDKIDTLNDIIKNPGNFQLHKKREKLKQQNKLTGERKRHTEYIVTSNETDPMYGLGKIGAGEKRKANPSDQTLKDAIQNIMTDLNMTTQQKIEQIRKILAELQVEEVTEEMAKNNLGPKPPPPPPPSGPGITVGSGKKKLRIKGGFTPSNYNQLVNFNPPPIQEEDEGFDEEDEAAFLDEAIGWITATYRDITQDQAQTILESPQFLNAIDEAFPDAVGQITLADALQEFNNSLSDEQKRAIIDNLRPRTRKRSEDEDTSNKKSKGPGPGPGSSGQIAAGKPGRLWMFGGMENPSDEEDPFVGEANIPQEEAQAIQWSVTNMPSMTNDEMRRILTTPEFIAEIMSATPGAAGELDYANALYEFNNELTPAQKRRVLTRTSLRIAIRTLHLDEPSTKKQKKDDGPDPGSSQKIASGKPLHRPPLPKRPPLVKSGKVKQKIRNIIESNGLGPAQETQLINSIMTELRGQAPVGSGKVGGRYQIRKVRNQPCYQVKNIESGKIHSTCTTKAKAKAQVRLLHGIEGNVGGMDPPPHQADPAPITTTVAWLERNLTLPPGEAENIIFHPFFRRITRTNTVPNACHKFNQLNDAGKLALYQAFREG